MLVGGAPNVGVEVETKGVEPNEGTELAGAVIDVLVGAVDPNPVVVGTALPNPPKPTAGVDPNAVEAVDGAEPKALVVDAPGVAPNAEEAADVVVAGADPNAEEPKGLVAAGADPNVEPDGVEPKVLDPKAGVEPNEGAAAAPKEVLEPNAVLDPKVLPAGALPNPDAPNAGCCCWIAPNAGCCCWAAPNAG